ncbi:DUF58 domain-containing protein [Bacillus taeanensis]|uniref:DUF58 domain-containing protein n=1 Tax=Bacillus taeanensis TaxID=273032 RepID=A0A366XRA2_9BACI|nr:DUF58 domain-containing protein [Bacillus taeanensis]RBW67299.1 hypothetical protein DS031_22960 [Bacillus taeanensis]
MKRWKRLKKQTVWLRLIFLLFLTGLAYSYAMFQGGFVSWFLFYSMLPMSIYAFLLTFYSLKSFQVTRELNQKRVHAGELLTVTVTVKRTSIFPLFYVVVAGELPLNLKKRANNIAANHQGARAIFFPFLKRSMSYSYEIHSLPRGFYTFNEIVIKTGDPFGFMQKEQSFFQDNTLLVYPSFQRMNWKPSHYTKRGEKSIHQKANQDLTTVVGIRDYAEGDRLSLLHWKASAKRNQLVTKEFEQQTNKRAILFVDRTFLKNDNQEAILFEKTISLSASLAHSLLAVNYDVGVISAGNNYMKIPFHGGKEQEQRIFSLLAKIKNDAKRSFASVIPKEVYHFPHETVCLVVTAHLCEELVNTLERLSLNNRHIMLFYVRCDANLTEQERQDVLKVKKSGILVYTVVHDHFEAELKKGEVRYAVGRTKSF